MHYIFTSFILYNLPKRLNLAESLGTKLDRIQKAIAKLEDGTVSSYEIEGRKITYHNIQFLYKREQELIRQIEMYGRDYVPGGNSNPIRRVVRVSFE